MTATAGGAAATSSVHGARAPLSHTLRALYHPPAPTTAFSLQSVFDEAEEKAASLALRDERQAAADLASAKRRLQRSLAEAHEWLAARRVQRIRATATRVQLFPGDNSDAAQVRAAGARGRGCVLHLRAVPPTSAAHACTP